MQQPETFLQKQLRLKAEREAVSIPRAPAPTTPVEAGNPRATRWVDVKLTESCRQVAGAPEGQRNDTLNHVAYSLGRLIPKWLDEATVADALLTAAHAAGLGGIEASNTIRSGLNSGQQDPRDPPVSDDSGWEVFGVQAPAQRQAIDGSDVEAREPADDTPSTWAPVDLAPYLDGTHVPEKPALLLRTDSQAAVYPGRVHWLSGEPEAMKSWLALLAVAQILHRGERAVYLDLEDGPAGIVGRLLAMGVPAETLRSRFTYLAPHEPLRYASRDLLAPVIAGTQLLVIDACTESLALQQLSPKDDVDVAAWLALLPRWATRQGPAVLVLDHVIKDAETRGRWATGSQHKLAGLDGVAFTLETVQPGGVGMRGRSRLYVSKDRHGQVRPSTVPTGHKQWLGDLVVDSTGAFVDVVLHPPVEQTEEFRPTVLMERVAAVLVKLGRPLSGKEIEDRVKGRAGDIRKALACLIDDGFVSTESGARGARLHVLDKPYPPVEEDSE